MKKQKIYKEQTPSKVDVLTKDGSPLSTVDIQAVDDLFKPTNLENSKVSLSSVPSVRPRFAYEEEAQDLLAEFADFSTKGFTFLGRLSMRVGMKVLTTLWENDRDLWTELITQRIDSHRGWLVDITDLHPQQKQNTADRLNEAEQYLREDGDEEYLTSVYLFDAFCALFYTYEMVAKHKGLSVFRLFVKVIRKKA